MGKNNKYKNENSIVSQERHDEIKQQIMQLLENPADKAHRALGEDEIAAALGISGYEAGEMMTCIDELVNVADIIRNRKGKYRIPEEGSVLTGRIQTTKRGFGFLIPDDGSEDVFIPREDMQSAMNGDRLLVKIDTGRKSRTGKRCGWIMDILERGTAEIIGTLVAQKHYAFVVSGDRRVGDVYIPSGDMCGAKNGDKVRAVITKYATEENGLRGKVAEIYGSAGSAEAELKAVLHEYHIPEHFDAEVLEEADAVSLGGISEGALSGREDLRGRLIITIDGPDAKDLDDAVSVERKENGNFVLGVHIADVSNYVREDSKLDKEALKRGCSVYLLDAVVPMLPEQLSNGVCSLNQGEDRLTLSMEAEIDQSGNIVSYRIFESVICSSARMVYDDVSDIIENHDEALMKKYEYLCPMIFEMDELARVLREKRMKGGSLDFDIDESYIELGEDGMPTDVRPADRRVANKIIEEFMLTANKVVAEHHYWMEVPFTYRVHEKPDQQKMESLKAFAGTLGYSLKGSCDNIHPAALRDILVQAEGSDAAGIINRVMLRSMKKADYQPVCSGHFGLGFKYYCHFTSPIRRYPDLIAHRIIKEIIHSEPGNLINSAERRAVAASKVENACDISSAQERNAVDAERTIEKKKKAQFMLGYKGEEFNGIISGVLNAGFFVELPNTIEGFVPMETLYDDYYELDADNYRIVGEFYHRVYRVGGKVRIRVEKVDIITDEIEFRVIEGGEMSQKSGKNSAKKKRRTKKSKTDLPK